MPKPVQRKNIYIRDGNEGEVREKKIPVHQAQAFSFLKRFARSGIGKSSGGLGRLGRL